MPKETMQAPAEFSLDTYRQTRGEVPAPAEEEKPSEAPAEEPEAKTEPESETGNEEQEHDEEQPKKKGGFQRRIDRLTREKAELAARLEALEAKAGGEKPAEAAPKPAAPTGKPSVEQFETYDEYVEALADWKTEQKLAARQQQDEEAKAKAAQTQRLAAWSEKVKAAESKYDDFEEVAYNPSVRITTAMQEAILESPVGPDLAYWLGSHPQDAARIADLSPVSQARELGKIEASLSAPPEPKKPKPSAAPAPIKPVSAAAAPSTKRVEDMSFDEYKSWRAAGGGR